MEIRENKLNRETNPFEIAGVCVFDDECKKIYSKYSYIKVSWINSNNDCGYLELLPYDKIISKHKELIDLSEDFKSYSDSEETDLIVEDIKNWLPIFRFPNEDYFCIDNRNGKIVFFEHEVFETGINLHGLVLARNINDLIEKWSEILFVDIYDWFEGVDENGIDLSKDIYKNILKLAEK